MKLKELVNLLGAELRGDPEIEINAAAGIEDAQEGDVTFISNRKYADALLRSKASAVIAREEVQGITAATIISPNPLFAFAKALEVLHSRPAAAHGISDRAVVCSGVHFGQGVTIFPNAYISSGVTIGSGVTVYPGVFIGEGSSIGDDSLIYPNVTIRERVRIGKKAIIHAGTVIGADGFGYVPEKGEHYKIPQVGGVIIGDNVEIGANVTIDRATTGNTMIGSGTKIDNLVQIAHNVKIGRNCIIVAQVGIAGSTTIGDNVILAGQAGVRDHLRIGNGVMIAAQSGVVHDVPDNEVYSGTPALPHSTWLRAQAIFSKLPEYIKRLQDIERKTDT